MYSKQLHIYFVGIGGIGMSGIAELLLSLGYQVSGSDLRSTSITQRLETLGATVYQGHLAEQVQGADVLVTSTAIAADNPELVQATADAIPVIQRAEMLAELMRLKKYGIAIAGSHGKTSTTSLVAAILAEAAFDPTVVVGGKVDSLGSNAKLGGGEFLIAEADESDGSFLKLSPAIEVITNIDLEHLEFYRDLDHVKEVFLAFIERLPFYGVAVVCRDDANVAEILPRIHAMGRRVMTYGLTADADLYADTIHFEQGQTRLRVLYQGEALGTLVLNRPGKHTLYNSLAAIGVALELKIPFPVIAQALETFQGVQRRLQIKGEADGVLVIDDYGHHPTELRATLDAIRQGWPDRRLVVAFQPHRYSRTQGLFDNFVQALLPTEHLLITEVYAASEKPLPGVSGESLVQALKKAGHQHVHFVDQIVGKSELYASHVQPGDLFLTLGAGNIVQAGEELLEYLSKDEHETTSETRPIPALP